MKAITIPIMLAKLNLTVKPKVKTSTFKSKISGEVSPKVLP